MSTHSSDQVISKKVADAAAFDIDLLESSFAILAPRGQTLARRFYKALFANAPAVKPMFSDVDMRKQQSKLIAALKLVINNLRNPDALEDALIAMGERHQGYGAEPEHYDDVVESLVEVMAGMMEDEWNDELEQSWCDALHHVSDVMLSAYEPTDNADETDGGVVGLSSEERMELVRLRSAMNGSGTATMMVNRDLEVTYANPATYRLLEENRAVFEEQYANFDPGALIGTCIDVFHKNPVHQRRILDDPNNLPWNTTISLGPLNFELNVTAMLDEKGEYIGTNLEWQDVTEKLRKETEVARLTCALDNVSTNLMMCDNEGIISYANQSVIDMMVNRTAELRSVFPGFDASKLVGASFDRFHANPAHQQGIIKDPANFPFNTDMSVAGLDFQLKAVAVTDHDDNFLGVAVEWLDVTDEKKTERELEALINSAAAGQLNERINTDELAGFTRIVGEGVNRMLDAVASPLQLAKQNLNRMADGDLTVSMDGDFEGEFAELQYSLNSTVAKLLETVTDVRNSADSISSAAKEVATGNVDLSQRTEEQASSLEQTAASMEQLTGTVKQNADNSRQANQLAMGAREQAEKGGHVVDEAITAMQEISKSSKQIADIIGVIDEIAFQTNLLALNAAVEAARAGDQGRGFAVVAAEVRNLAQRSATAAKEIKSLIQDSGEKVQEGSDLVNQSGQTLNEIVDSVKKVGDIISEIAAASNEQSQGIEQINQAVAQMDEMTQQNAALVEESAAASESMEQQAGGMIALMNFFHIGQVTEQTEAQSMPRIQAPVSAKPLAAKTPVSAESMRASEGNDSEWDEF